MSKLRLELRKLILQEMRKREFGESKNPTWVHSNMRLADIINEEMGAIDSTANPLDKTFNADNELIPSDFDTWNKSEPEPEDIDWGLPETEVAEGQPVSPVCLEAILSHMNAWMDTAPTFGSRISSDEGVMKLYGQIAGNMESIQSNAQDAAAGTMSAYDIGELEALADVNGPSYKTLMSDPNGAAIVATINKILSGGDCSAPGSVQTQPGAIDVG